MYNKFIYIPRFIKSLNIFTIYFTMFHYCSSFFQHASQFDILQLKYIMFHNFMFYS